MLYFRVLKQHSTSITNHKKCYACLETQGSAQLTIPSLTCPWLSITLCSKESMRWGAGEDTSIFIMGWIDRQTQTRTPFPFGLVQNLFHCGFEWAWLVLLQHLPEDETYSTIIQGMTTHSSSCRCTWLSSLTMSSHSPLPSAWLSLVLHPLCLAARNSTDAPSQITAKPSTHIRYYRLTITHDTLH